MSRYSSDTNRALEFFNLAFYALPKTELAFKDTPLALDLFDEHFETPKDWAVFSERWYQTSLAFNRKLLEVACDYLFAGMSKDQVVLMDRLLRQAMGIGALVREFELRSRNEGAAKQGHRDTRARKAGGAARARPDRMKIIEAMRQRIDAGQTVRQAARASFEVDKLGQSETANVGVWNRRPKN